MAFSNTLAAASRGLRSFGIYVPRMIENSKGKSMHLRTISGMKDEVCHVAGLVAKENLIVGMGGNFSVEKDGFVVIKGSGYRAATLKPEQCPVVDLATGEPIHIFGEKPVKPSCEVAVHLSAYLARADVRAVVHSHNPIATAFATLDVPMFPITPDFVAVLKIATPIPRIPYVSPSSKDLARAISEPLQKNFNAVLMGKHGVFCVGGNSIEAFDRAHLIEESAKTYLAMYAILSNEGLNLKDADYTMTPEDCKTLLGSEFERFRQQLAAEQR